MLALPMRWYGWHAARDREFQARIAAIEKLGGQVMFDSPVETASFDAALWRMVGGTENRGRPAAIILGNSRVSDARVAALSLETFPGLSSLTLDGADVSDSSARMLEKLSGLTDLSLANTKITDRTLVAIGRLGQLTSLDLTGTVITDAGLSQLTALKHLETLNVRDTAVRKQSIAKLQAALPETLINRNPKR
jgi:hypothetical protein